MIEIGTRLLFLTLELNRIEDPALAEKIEQSPVLARYQPWLRDVRSFRPHQLDDEIERVLHEKSVTGRSAGSVARAQEVSKRQGSQMNFIRKI